ncbi:MAG TPA: SpoIIE family protein phosphatase, partial [Thermoanaerobaculia bacterium]|nr:SpoIIE family protein phosphatase [Thermoanaerobaculia bacterium]
AKEALAHRRRPDAIFLRTVPLKRSTKIWLLLFSVSVAVTATIHSVRADMGCLGVLTAVLAFVSGMVLLAFGIAAAFRAIIRRLTLRLAFSYFLIGIVPIPLLAMLFFCLAYVTANQFIATRVRREVSVIAEQEAARPGALPRVHAKDGRVVSSEVPWLAPGDKAPWAAEVASPKPIISGEEVWIAAPAPDGLALLHLTDRSKPWLQRLADHTGYAVRVEAGTARTRGEGFNFDSGQSRRKEGLVRPAANPSAGKGVLDSEWVGAIYLESAVAGIGRKASERNAVLYLATASPRLLFTQLFTQGVPRLANVFRAVLMGLSVILLLVYLVALAIAFGLVGSIARNVNRLTRASQAIARGDFSVRVQSRSRDQIGDLARSFDGMASSIEGLLIQTTEKERLEGEIAIARTIQQKLLPPPEATLPGISLLAEFQSLAALGGDYYDYFSMPDGRSAVAVGDVSGHGLPTGLLVAMAKAGLSTLVESGLAGAALFTRLNDLIHRSTDSRNYMTLALLAYEPASRRAELTNAGQLAPYRLSAGGLESLSLPSFPLGVSERSDFPIRAFQFASGDRLVFVTDGFVEAASPEGEPFGFEKLEGLLRAEISADAARLRDAILAAVTAHTRGAPPADDRTLVILTLQ